VNVSSSALLAYALARFRFPGSKFLYAVVIFANTIPIIGAGPAQYKLAMSLKMINNPATIWLMWAGGFDFAFIVLYGYFKGVSRSYSESAKMDGANNWVVFIKVILPQVTPCIVAIAITQATGVWNNYSISMLYLRDYPNLAYGMYLFKDSSFLVKDSMPVYFAAAVISCIPIIVLYTCSQNLILNNMTTGGLKG
jgi:raffinose/stachyose/melibiose transport system permease protein/N-acetylglucosamine transport system permease protein